MFMVLKKNLMPDKTEILLEKWDRPEAIEQQETLIIAVAQRLRNELVIPVGQTFGYITKLKREQAKLEKTHMVDARCIADGMKAIPCDTEYHTRALRHHNRQLHKANPIKGGKRKLNQAPRKVFGFMLWDKVLYNNQECFISGRRSSGSFAVKTLEGKSVHNGVSCKKLKLLE